MREILFRAWSEKRQCYELDVSIVNGCPVRYGYMWFNKENDVLESQPEQFTGLCDKDGKKIFEGDIVFAGYGEYYQGQHEYSKTIIIDMADYEALNALCNANVVEVIGNIHDTPDLETEEESE